MADMVPPIISDAEELGGERDVFHALRSDPVARDWIVLHSLDLPRMHRKNMRRGEADFVVLAPGIGCMVIEVKGSRNIGLRNGLWYYGVDRQGKQRSPFKQASDARFAIERDLEKRLRAASELPWVSLVVFPRTHFDLPASTEWQPWHLIDQRDIESTSLAKAMVNAMQRERRYQYEHHGLLGYDPALAQPSRQLVRRIADKLRPDFEPLITPKERRELVERDLRRCTATQSMVLRRLKANPRLLIEGPAGSGKTLIALEAARRSAAEGQRVLLLCFNRNLARHLQSEMDGEPNVSIDTIHRWMMQKADNPEVEEQSDWWTAVLPELAMENVSADSIDVLILDEAQDILRDEWLTVMDEALVDGLEEGCWRMFGDFSGQNIYGGDERIWQGLPGARCDLRENCRNTPEIVEWMRVLQLVNPFYEEVLRMQGGPLPAIHVVESGSEIETLEAELAKLSSDGIKLEDIVVLSPYRDEATWQRLGNVWASKSSPVGARRRHTIGLGTIHEFKGLESSAVILTDMDQDLAERRDLLYVGVTRATDQAIVLVDAAMQKDMQRVLMSGAKE